MVSSFSPEPLHTHSLPGKHLTFHSCTKGKLSSDVTSSRPLLLTSKVWLRCPALHSHHIPWPWKILNLQWWNSATYPHTRPVGPSLCVREERRQGNRQEKYGITRAMLEETWRALGTQGWGTTHRQRERFLREKSWKVSRRRNWKVSEKWE